MWRSPPSAFRHRERLHKEAPQAGQSPPDFAAEVPQLLRKWGGFTSAAQKAELAGIPIHIVRYEAMLNDCVASLRGCVDHLLPDNSFQALSGGRELLEQLGYTA